LKEFAMDILMQVAIILVCLFYGARKGGVALGLLGGIGIVLMTFVFGLPPGKPPVDVMLTIIAVVAASATLQASGGLEVLLLGAEKILRRNPKYVSILAPFTTCLLTILCGTGHVVYTMLPIIYDIAIKNDIRPERPMAASSVASQMGILASPVSVAVVSLVAFLAKVPVDGHVIDFIQVLSITIPSTLAGVLLIGIFSWFRGKDLKDDPEFQKRIADPEQRQIVYGESATLMGKVLTRSQWTAMWIFIGSIAVVAILGAVPIAAPADQRQTAVHGADHPDVHAAGRCADDHVHQDRPLQIGKTDVFRAGMIAVVAVFGIAWMADTVFEAHLPVLKATLTDLVKTQPWTYAIALLLVSKLVNSQAAAISAMVPVGLAIGVPPGYIVAFAAASYGYYILPTYPSDLAAIQFDRSGTTHIGKYVINHSFIVPGLIGVGTSCLAGYLLAGAYGLI
jgi:anaerobic C4-dicarboxylate transporter DcuB